jgi:ABC-type multidrug transport system fused ATPase/permease subunit
MEKKQMIFLNQIINIRIKALFFIQLFFQAVCAIISVFPVLLIRDIVDLAAYGEKQNIRKIIYIGCFYLGIQIFHGLLSALTKYLSSWLQANISLTLEGHIFHHISKVNLQAIKFSDSVRLSNILAQDSQFISENMVTSFGEFTSAVLSFLFGFYFVSSINRSLAFIVLPLGLISSLIIRKISDTSYKNLLEQRENSTKLWKIFYEAIMGFLPLRFHDTIDLYSKKIEVQGKLLENTTVKQGSIESLSSFATRTLFMVTIGLIMITSAIFVVNGSLTLGGLTAVMMYNHMLSDPLIKLQEINHKIQRLKVSLSRVLNMLSLPAETPPEKGGIDEIELIGVTWEIDGYPVLSHIDLHIFKGQSLIITGPSGTGKTTLANLLAGIYSCVKGKVIFKEKGNVSSKRPKVSYMLQDEYLFDDTIYQNILTGNPTLPDETLKNIISICELEDIIRHHKGPIGENGICLSGGERKRVLIARTIADYDSDLFIFDEMSASLDHDTFLRIWNRVDHYLKAKSRVYIEHNRSIQKLVDCVIDVDSRFRVADLHN